MWDAERKREVVFPDQASLEIVALQHAKVAARRLAVDAKRERRADGGEAEEFLGKFVRYHSVRPLLLLRQLGQQGVVRRVALGRLDVEDGLFRVIVLDLKEGTRKEIL